METQLRGPGQGGRASPLTPRDPGSQCPEWLGQDTPITHQRAQDQGAGTVSQQSHPWWLCPPHFRGPIPKEGGTAGAAGQDGGPRGPVWTQGCEDSTLPPRRQRKPLCEPRRGAHRAQRAIFPGTLASVTRPRSAGPRPSWHAQGLLLVLFFLFFLLLLKEKWWEGPLGYAYALTIDWFLWPDPELPPGHSASTRPFFLPSFVSSFTHSCSQQPRVLRAPGGPARGRQ